jgi:predicted phosphoribosyltransferase
MFSDRQEAGKLLARELEKYKQISSGIVLAIPRGGVPLGYEVSKALHLPLDLILTKKIGHPFNKEYAIGAVSLTDSIIDPHPDVTREYIDSEIKTVREKLMSMSEKYLNGKKHADLKDKTVIVVDDGIATGNTLLATIQMIRKQQPARIVVAVPVAPPAAIQKIKPAADEVISLIITPDFGGVGFFYENFRQVSDEEVIQYLFKRDEELRATTN